MLDILVQKLGLYPFWLNLRAIWREKKYQKSKNMKSEKSLFVDLMRSTAPQNWLKPLIDLKMVLICLGWSMEELLVYGQLSSAFYGLIVIRVAWSDFVPCSVAIGPNVSNEQKRYLWNEYG